jgi:hypothetical protein
MKKYIYLFLFIFCLPLVSKSQNATEAMASFKPILKSVDDLFSGSPIVLNSEDYRRSPSGKINYLLRFEKLDIAYDIKKADSLISPFTAYISLRLKFSNNAIYGDIKESALNSDHKTIEYNWGFQNAEDAIKKQDFASCMASTAIIAGDPKIDETFPRLCQTEAKILYAYQDNKWVFKDINSTHLILRENLLSNPDWAKYILPKK